LILKNYKKLFLTNNNYKFNLNNFKIMASNSEVGFAKTIANLDLLITHIREIENIYRPSNPKIALSNLRTIYDSAYQQQTAVNTLLSPYSLAVDDREVIFKPLSRELTKLRKAYKATEGVTLTQLEDLMTIIRKLKGIRKSKNKPSTNPEEEQASHSISQMSFDQRTDNLELLIALLQNTPNFNPNEEEYKVATYQNKKASMLAATSAVAAAYIPLNSARSLRNATVYNGEDNLVDIANRAKDYIFTILDVDSVQYKAIAKIKFKKR